MHRLDVLHGGGQVQRNNPTHKPEISPNYITRKRTLTDWMRSTVVAKSSATRGIARLGLPRDSRTGVCPVSRCTANITSSTIGFATTSFSLRVQGAGGGG